MNRAEIDLLDLPSILRRTQAGNSLSQEDFGKLADFLCTVTERWQCRTVLDALEKNPDFRASVFAAATEDSCHPYLLEFLVFHTTADDDKRIASYPQLLQQTLVMLPAGERKELLNTINPLDDPKKRKSTVAQGIVSYKRMDLLETAFQGFDYSEIDTVLTAYRDAFRYGGGVCPRSNVGTTISFLLGNRRNKFTADILDRYYPSPEQKIELMNRRPGPVVAQVLATEDPNLVGKFFQGVSTEDALHLLFTQTMGGDALDFTKHSPSQVIALISDPTKQRQILWAIFPGILRDDQLHQRVLYTSTGYRTISQQPSRYLYNSTTRTFRELNSPATRPENAGTRQL